MGIYAFSLWILNVTARWFLFEKAGEAGWKSLVPYYNKYITCRLAGKKNLFVADLILSLLTDLGVLAAWIMGVFSLLSFGFGYSPYQYTALLKRAPLEMTPKIFTLILITMILGLAVAVLRMVINVCFVKRFSEETVFQVLAAVGSVQAFCLLGIICRSILAFDPRYVYHAPGGSEAHTTFDSEGRPL